MIALSFSYVFVYFYYSSISLNMVVEKGKKEL